MDLNSKIKLTFLLLQLGTSNLRHSMDCFQKYKNGGPRTPHFLAIGGQISNFELLYLRPQEVSGYNFGIKNVETKAKLKFRNSETWGPPLNFRRIQSTFLLDKL